MRICSDEDCGYVFPEESLIHKHIPGTRYEPPEDYFIAPCGHEEDEEADYCKYCDEWHRPADRSEIEGMCEHCFAAAAKECLDMIEAHGSSIAIAFYSFLRGA